MNVYCGDANDLVPMEHLGVFEAFKVTAVSHGGRTHMLDALIVQEQ